MVTDDIRYVEQYEEFGQRIKKGLHYLRSSDLKSVQDGTYEIDGDDVYVVVRTYQTKPQGDCRWEAHKKYIDIQYVIEGEECIGYAFVEDLQSNDDYCDDNDVYFLEGDGDTISFKPGRFMVLWPQDAHMPQVQKNGSHTVRKAVVKIKV